MVIKGCSLIATDNLIITDNPCIYIAATSVCAGVLFTKKGEKCHTQFTSTHRQVEKFILVSHQDQFKKDGKTELDISNTDILMPLYKNMDGKISLTKYFSLI